jgi:ankyrin repeat protein
MASWQGSVQIVISLLRAGADPNIQEECTFFPIHKAAIRGYADIIHHLMKGGTDPNCIDYEGYTPLHLAAKSGHYEACEVLYRAGADPMKANHYLFTPLDFAVRFNFDDIVTLLQTPRSKLALLVSSRSDAPKSVASTRNKDLISSRGKPLDTPIIKE